MKRHVLDLLIPLVITLNGILSYLFTKYCLSSLFHFYFMEYAILFNALFVVLLFGLFSSFLIRLVLIFFPLDESKLELGSRKATIWKLYALLYMLGGHSLNPLDLPILKPWVIKLFGARIGKRVAIAGHVNEPKLVSIGSDSILGHYTLITPHTLLSGKLFLKRIKIGNNVTVGVSSIILPGAVIGDNSVILPNSVVTMNTQIGSNEIWGGTPAVKIKSTL